MNQADPRVPMPRICSLLHSALQNIDWRFVSLSLVDYRQEEAVTNELLERWQERPLAYEIYHQVRLLMEDEQSYVVQSEVRKGYQGLLDFDYMPDFIFHVADQVGANFGAVEIKMAARGPKKMLDDIKKLKVFRDKLGYEELIAVAIGKDEDLVRCRQGLGSAIGYEVHFLSLSTDSRKADYHLVKIEE